MKRTRRVAGSLLSVATAVLAAVVASSVSYGRNLPATSTASCDQPCAHVQDCPKVSCECDHGTASDVAVCDAKKTHCCWSAGAACKRFCAAKHQTWTGKFGPVDVPPIPLPPSGDDSAATSSSTCNHSCKEAGDCPTISCQCEHAIAANVAACDVAANCCGEARVVCEHFCGAKKDRWTGKLAPDAAPDEAPGREEPGADE